MMFNANQKNTLIEIKKILNNFFKILKEYQQWLQI